MDTEATYKGRDIELIYIETEYFTFTIKGKPVHPDIEQLYPDRDNSAIKANLSVDPINCALKEFSHFDPKGGLKAYRSEKVFPFFYEWQDYQIIIESKGDLELEFYHENKKVREAVTSLSRNKNILMGKFNFRNDVGYSELEIRKKGLPILILKIEVFPSKIDYQQDYYNLIREVNEEVYNLAYDFLRKTFQNMRLVEADNVSDSEFFTILKTIFSGFKKSFRMIEKFPHHRLNKVQKVKASGRVKRINKQSIKWLRKNSKFYDRESGLPMKILDINKQISFNTYENKFVKWIIIQTIKRIKRFLIDYKLFYRENTDIKVVEFANQMSRELDLILHRTFLKNVGELYKVDSLSLVLQMSPGYRELYKYYLMLKKGLSFNGELFRLSMKETWKLYEYWCFLKINQILRKKYKLVKNNLIKFNYSGVYISLNTSTSAAVEYENPETGERFTLSYNTKAGEDVTTGQKPDNILSLQKKGSNNNYKFVFDAKYRINPAYQDTYYGNKYGIAGPEEDTINTMHRYRDAIVYQDKSRLNRTMAGAYVLFPYHDEDKFKEHKFYKSIDQVNVGAFPFLPNSTELLSEFLSKLIEETSASNYERNILPIGTEEYQKKVDFKKNVLVGNLSKKQQLNIVLNQKIYHIPCREIKFREDKLEYIAIYQSKKKFPENYGVKYYAKIKYWEVKKRKDIDIPLSKNSEKERAYYIFHVEKWEELKQLVLPEGYGVSGSHIYTNDMLLRKAETLPELSIKTLEEWRIWLELKRIKEKLVVRLDDKNIRDTSQIKGFEIDEIKVRIVDSYVLINKGDIILKKSIKEFTSNLRKILNEIRN